VGRVALAVWLLAAAGCRQLFGIDDTTQAPDALVPTGPCAASHLACADFDTDATGLAQFPTEVTPGGSLAEGASVIARSPPRVLIATNPAGPNTDFAVLGFTPAVPLRHLAATTSIVTPAQSCEPFVLATYFGLPGSATLHGALLYRRAQGYSAFVFVDTAVVEHVVTAAVGDGMHRLALEVDFATASLIVRIDDEVQLFAEPLLADPGYVIAGVTLGLSYGGAHPACEARFDDFVVDAL
jgi:hypothetical protein